MSESEATFWEQRRLELGYSQRRMATELGISNSSVMTWEDRAVVPQVPIAAMARAYQTSESRIEKELMVQRRFIEGRRAAEHVGGAA